MCASSRIRHAEHRTTARARWDGASVHAFDGTYGDYVLGKVAKVFPGAAGQGPVATLAALSVALAG